MELDRSAKSEFYNYNILLIIVDTSISEFRGTRSLECCFSFLQAMYQFDNYEEDSKDQAMVEDNNSLSDSKNGSDNEDDNNLDSELNKQNEDRPI